MTCGHALLQESGMTKGAILALNSDTLKMERQKLPVSHRLLGFLRASHARVHLRKLLPQSFGPR